MGVHKLMTRWYLRNGGCSTNPAVWEWNTHCAIGAYVDRSHSRITFVWKLYTCGTGGVEMTCSSPLLPK